MGGVSASGALPAAGHLPSSGAGACSVANTTLTTGMNELSLNQSQHKKPALVGVQHMKKELNIAGKDAGKHKAVATSPAAAASTSSASATINSVLTENIAGSTASKLSYAQVAQHHKTASESKDGGGTMSPTSSHKLGDLVFGDTGAATGDKNALTVTTDKRLSGSSNVGKGAGGAQTMNSTPQAGGAAAAGKDKGKFNTQ